MNPTERYAYRQWLDIKECQKYTVRLLANHKNIYKIHGTGVLVSVKNSKYLLTASHVVDKYDKLMIPLDSYNVMIPGGIVKFSLFEGNRENDSIDIAMIQLDSETIKELSPYYSFLPETSILTKHNSQKSLFYTYLGYPSTFSKLSHSKDSFHSRVFFQYNFQCDEEIYTKLNRSPKTNIIIKYDKKNSLNTQAEIISVGPDLYGMSGCGLWFTDPMDIYSEIPNPKLVAIMTDWPIKNRKCVIGTKMDIIMDSIKKEFTFENPML